MQDNSSRGDLSLTFYCKDPDSKDVEDCPSFYRTSEGSWMVQGLRHGERVAVQLRALKDDETFVEIPDALAERFVRMYAKERYGVDLSPEAGCAGAG
ncbi:hypothetical protein AB0I81_05970 [Nonomuraea sp. NPDC050404]|uniref:hypothetical protein n=1 Tax=Nonomuraea sp. NPDC050404 TaxID=3155783 RepID=UPI00340724D4